MLRLEVRGRTYILWAETDEISTTWFEKIQEVQMENAAIRIQANFRGKRIRSVAQESGTAGGAASTFLGSHPSLAPAFCPRVRAGQAACTTD